MITIKVEDTGGNGSLVERAENRAKEVYKKANHVPLISLEQAEKIIQNFSADISDYEKHHQSRFVSKLDDFVKKFGLNINEVKYESGEIKIGFGDLPQNICSNFSYYFTPWMPMIDFWGQLKIYCKIASGHFKT